jgi:hypothetical protein
MTNVAKTTISVAETTTEIGADPQMIEPDPPLPPRVMKSRDDHRRSDRPADARRSRRSADPRGRARETTGAPMTQGDKGRVPIAIDSLRFGGFDPDAVGRAYEETPPPDAAITDYPVSPVRPGEQVPHSTGTEQGQSLSDGARLVTFSSIVAQPVTYLDEERTIPLRAVTVLAGPQGLGKSQWTIRLAAKNSGHTIIASSEDSDAAVVRPRLEAAGADLNRVHNIVMRREGLDGDIDLPDDVAELDRLVQDSGATLVVIDPLMAHLPDRINSWRDQSVRRALAPLQRLAEEHGCAVVVIVHLNKGEGDDPLQRVGGSVGITAAARSVLLLARDPDDPDGDKSLNRVLAHIKSNYGPLRPSLALSIEPFLLDPDGKHIETSRVTVIGASVHLGRDLLAQPDRQEQKLERATRFLTDELEKGPQPRKQLEERADAEGISFRTLERAKAELGERVRAFRVGEPGHRGSGASWWGLSGDTEDEPINTANPEISPVAALIVEPQTVLFEGPAVNTAANPAISRMAAVLIDVGRPESWPREFRTYYDDAVSFAVGGGMALGEAEVRARRETVDLMRESGLDPLFGVEPDADDDIRGWFEATISFAVNTGMNPVDAWRIGVMDVLDRFANTKHDTGMENNG